MENGTFLTLGANLGQLRDSNPLSQDYKSSVLPLCYKGTPIIVVIAVQTKCMSVKCFWAKGLEPPWVTPLLAKTHLVNRHLVSLQHWKWHFSNTWGQFRPTAGLKPWPKDYKSSVLPLCYKATPIIVVIAVPTKCMSVKCFWAKRFGTPHGLLHFWAKIIWPKDI